MPASLSVSPAATVPCRSTLPDALLRRMGQFVGGGAIPEQRRGLISHPLGKGHHAFTVSRVDFEAARGNFAKAGVESAAPIDWGDHDCLYFLDPDGNLLEIVSYR